jgi:hypothetical protein
MAHDLTSPQKAQLQLLLRLGAVKAQKAVGRYSLTNGLGVLNPVMIGVALVPRGYAERIEVPAFYDVPAHHAYWLTNKGKAWAQHFNQAED